MYIEETTEILFKSITYPKQANYLQTHHLYAPTPHKKTILAKRAFLCVLDQAKHTLVLFQVSKASEAPTVELLLRIGKHMHCDQKFKKEKLKLKFKPKKTHAL
jgi:hypothetical protein